MPDRATSAEVLRQVQTAPDLLLVSHRCATGNPVREELSGEQVTLIMDSNDPFVCMLQKQWMQIDTPCGLGLELQSLRRQND